MPSKKIRVIVQCVANHYAADTERIIEFASPNGGGLISFRMLEDGRLIVNAYRTDPTVETFGKGA